MKNISQPLTPKFDKPIDPITVSVIREIHNASEKLGFPVFLVGACARVILLENICGLKASRATLDIDFAFALDNWEQFSAIKKFLVSNANFKESAAAQRLSLSPSGSGHDVIVDLIPFGGIEYKPSAVAWPPDLKFIMNVAGYNDALSSSVLVEVSPGLTISIASLPGISILKLFAWSDRGHQNPKDAIDFNTLLRNYYDAGNLQRIYEGDALIALEKTGYDVELAGSWLLGKDAAAIASQQTRTELQMLLMGVKKSQLVSDMSRELKGRENASEYSLSLLEQFIKGFTV